MQLTREYGHPSRRDFSGAVAGTPEEALRYWNDPNSTRDTNEYWRIYSLGEASSSQGETAQLGEASSNNDTGLSGEKRQAIKSLLLGESHHRMRDSKEFAKSIQDVSEAKQCLNYLKSLKSSAFQDNFSNPHTFVARRKSLSQYIKNEWSIR